MGTGSFASAHELLAAEVLAELPKQVEKYYQNCGFSHRCLVRRLDANQPPRFVRTKEEVDFYNGQVGQQNDQQTGPQQNSTQQGYMHFNQQFNNINLHK